MCFIFVKTEHANLEGDAITIECFQYFSRLSGLIYHGLKVENQFGSNLSMRFLLFSRFCHSSGLYRTDFNVFFARLIPCIFLRIFHNLNVNIDRILVIKNELLTFPKIISIFSLKISFFKFEKYFFSSFWVSAMEFFFFWFFIAILDGRNVKKKRGK